MGSERRRKDSRQRRRSPTHPTIASPSSGPRRRIAVATFAGLLLVTGRGLIASTARAATTAEKCTGCESA
jgi:hypothetical protein